MSTINRKSRLRFWGWVVGAFLLGVVFGFVVCVVILMVLQAMTSYAQHG